MAIYGANRYTNIVFAEDEDGLPADWEPLNASYFGYPRGTNTVAMHPVAGTNNVNKTSVGTPETALSALSVLAGMMCVPNWNYWGKIDRFEGSPGIVMVARGTAQGLSRFGWSKEKVQAFLWESSKVPWSLIEKTATPDVVRDRCENTRPYLSMSEPWPITSKPENIMIVVAGGEQSGHGYWMQLGVSFKPVCKEVKLPSHWSKLLLEAENDPGP